MCHTLNIGVSLSRRYSKKNLGKRISRLVDLEIVIYAATMARSVTEMVVLLHRFGEAADEPSSAAPVAKDLLRAYAIGQPVEKLSEATFGQGADSATPRAER